MIYDLRLALFFFSKFFLILFIDKCKTYNKGSLQNYVKTNTKAANAITGKTEFSLDVCIVWCL